MATDLVLGVGNELQLLIAGTMNCDLHHTQLRFEAPVSVVAGVSVLARALVKTGPLLYLKMFIPVATAANRDIWSFDLIGPGGKSSHRVWTCTRPSLRAK